MSDRLKTKHFGNVFKIIHVWSQEVMMTKSERVALRDRKKKLKSKYNAIWISDSKTRTLIPTKSSREYLQNNIC